jgi:zinc-ribbon domain
MRRAFVLLGSSAAITVAWIALLPSQAIATVTGPCTVSIDGVDVTSGHDTPGGAVRLQSGSLVPIDGTARSRVTDLTYTVHIAGGEVQVGTVTIAQDGLGWSGTVDLESISDATVGLFEVTTEVQTTGRDCSGVAYVCVEGRSPFTTVAGAGATAVGLGGGVLLVLSFTRAGRLGAGRAPLQGFAGGATAGLGGAVLVQQFCVVPLTPVSVAGIPVIVGTAGAVGASLARRAGARGARRGPRLDAGHGKSGAPGALGGDPTEVIEHAGHEPAGTGYGPGGPSAIGGGGPGPAPTAPILPAPPSPSGGAFVPQMPPPTAIDEITCSNCGEASPAGSRFCSNCGTRIGSKLGEPPG